MPSAIRDSESTSVLLTNLKAYLWKYLDFPPFELSLFAHYVMMSYIWDRWTAIPYLRSKASQGRVRHVYSKS